MQRKGVSPGFPTGIDTFDNWRGGLLPRWLVTLAARPGMGKTTAVIAMIIHMVIEKGIPVVFFSLEMSAIDLKYKMAAGMTEIDFQKINSGQLTNEELDLVNQALDKIDESPLRIIDDLKDLEIIVSETRKLAQEGFRVFFLDYVQLVETPNSKENETAKLTETTRKLRAVKNELNILFVQLAQLSREPDKRPGHRPQLSDLKMSGSLEEDSDMVIFILRPEYYNKDKAKVPPAPGKPNPEYIAEWIVAKGRATGVADFDIYIDFSLMKMESFSGIQF
jgi:replicative DNA helicase